MRITSRHHGRKQEWTSPEDEPAIYAGERVTCEHGHLICSVDETIHQQDTNWAKKLCDWQMDVPKRGEKLPVCNICGAYFCGGYFGSNLHIEHRGWVSRYKTVRMMDGTVRNTNVQPGLM